LPESAVVTGLWLGNSPERAERFAYRVAPRGAAQAIYRSEVRYNRDPALIEQIGPRQYRLRIFPVEPRQVRWEEGSVRSTVVEGPPLYMWLTWRALAGEDGWPLPRLAEQRNVYWDVMSDRLVNGELLADGEEEWLPASVPILASAEPATHRVDFPGGETVIVRPVQAADLPKLPGDLRLAVVLDRSRSMEEQAAEVRVALARLADVAAGLAEVGAAVDVYLTASPYRGEEASLVSLDYLEPGSLLYVGGQNAVELLGQFDALYAGQRYDAIFVLTDGSGYELGDAGVQVRVPDAPVWMVHVGGGFPLGYDDATLEAIQASGGGVAGDVTEALTRLAAAREGARAGASSYDVVDGYVWMTVPTEAADAEVAPGAVVGAADEGFAALAARRLILAAMQRERGGLGQLEALDRLHAIAVEQGIVTPYSSMIVLVNERQEQLLDELEERADRFQREAEEVGETTQQSPFAVTGVPEPEEWLLLAVAAGMLGWYVWTRRGVPEASARC
ncbi:MAG TPA: TIGR02921 family PEP-CTERM protein, partial [Anaerolineae bacterium]|nr:TIGR02921 family PEP-CTERM protein [Anaerolineae bacterium]